MTSIKSVGLLGDVTGPGVRHKLFKLNVAFVLAENRPTLSGLLRICQEGEEASHTASRRPTMGGF